MARRPASEQFDGLKEVREAAFSLFGRYGYDGVSIDAIAKTSGTSKSALYWHFKNKQALFLDCLEQLHTMFIDTLFEPVSKAPDPATAIALFFKKSIVLLHDQRIQQGIAGYWLEAGSLQPEEVQAEHKNFNHSVSNIMKDVFEEGQAQKIFNLSTSPEKLSKTIISTFEALMLPLRGQSLEEKEEMVKVLANILFRAHLSSHEIADDISKSIFNH